MQLPHRWRSRTSSRTSACRFSRCSSTSMTSCWSLATSRARASVAFRSASIRSEATAWPARELSPHSESARSRKPAAVMPSCGWLHASTAFKVASACERTRLQSSSTARTWRPKSPRSAGSSMSTSTPRCLSATCHIWNTAAEDTSRVFRTVASSSSRASLKANRESTVMGAAAPSFGDASALPSGGSASRGTMPAGPRCPPPFALLSCARARKGA
mmetsp:Transcript_5812/g.18003  ORF Transcript_5812/g.18003 Transcript_5812/m.18003 type:complete len:216 (+) Transcript_5812:486-1133(+)